MELIDIYDEFMNLKETGISKNKAHAEGLWHFCSHIWIYTQDGYVLFQKRAADKKQRPNLLDISAAGHVLSGETILQGAIREIKEELNIDLKQDLHGLKLANIYQKNSGNKVIEGIIDNEFDAIFLLQLNDREDISFEFSDGEVQSVEWIHISKLFDEKFQDISCGFVPKSQLYRDIVFGSIKRTLL